MDPGAVVGSAPGILLMDDLLLEQDPDSKEPWKAWTYQRAPDGKDEWLTPPEVLSGLGEFDLDPCSPIVRPWPTAHEHFTIADNGLLRAWAGRVFCNPPYTTAGAWLGRCAEHGNAIAMVFARTETKMFFDWVWNRSDAVLFIKGRVTFRHVDGSVARYTGGAPSCLIAYGANNVKALELSGITGKLIDLRASRAP